MISNPIILLRLSSFCLRPTQGNSTMYDNLEASWTLYVRGGNPYPGREWVIVELEVSSSQEIRLVYTPLQSSRIYALRYQRKKHAILFSPPSRLRRRPLFISAMQSCNYLRAEANFHS
uniref:Uncharacterized protein n=1 Tax=Phlegmariurus squarrosus TaxID=73615 RepID=H9M858_PHLSQ|nr:hypothetical protein HusqMp75 [Phlegmariurus squarrosus]AEV55765.1 hypothetical protein HusqMp75 [Phlegmariurus squarrosus]